MEKVVQQGSICIGLSDHNLIYCIRKVSKIPMNRHNTVKIRSLKNYCQKDFTSKVEMLIGAVFCVLEMLKGHRHYWDQCLFTKIF